ncbi:MAG: bifunctional phosphopantothenoylcysteine decarboxylase/phosphopantothenate--cysteine ligase CoaBC [Synechococcus sp.]
MRIDGAGSLKGRRCLVACCGSIAAVKTPLLVSALVKAGADVRCVVTPSASRLVSPVALASLSRHRCYQDGDEWSASCPRPLHIELAEWAELVIVAPLSATSLGRWCAGLADGLLASLLLATEAPVLAAAAMNTGMWSHPAVRQNWAILQSWPRVLPLAPGEGLLACDRIGPGRMAEPERILLAAASLFCRGESPVPLPRDWSGRRLLVSAGPTLEQLDEARLITNRSSGVMGVLLAQAAALRGAEVELVHGPLRCPEPWLEGLRCHAVTSAGEMERVLQAHQADAAAVAMVAAVADLRRFDGGGQGKQPKQQLIDSIGSGWTLVPDLLKGLARSRPPGQVLLGFAALAGEEAQMRRLGEQKRVAKGCDLLMVNPIDRPDQGFESPNNGGWLLDAHGCTVIEPSPKLAVAQRLLDHLLDAVLKAQDSTSC